MQTLCFTTLKPFRRSGMLCILILLRNFPIFSPVSFLFPTRIHSLRTQHTVLQSIIIWNTTSNNTTVITREKPGIALTSFCLVWRSYNPMWVFFWFPYGWKQISSSNINVHKIKHCSFFSLSVLPAPWHTSSHTSLSYL